MLWGDWGWCWGELGGEANMVAEGLRLILATEEERAKFLTAVETDAEFEATKVVLALKIERSSMHPQEHDLADDERVAWRAVLEDMIECRFEGDDGDEKLVVAIGACLGGNAVTTLSSTRSSIAAALDHLSFVEAGI